MVSDLLSDMVARINNGYRAGLVTVEVINSKLVLATAKALTDCGYLSGAKPDKRKLHLDLKYEDKNPAIMGIRRVSKPGARRYVGWQDLPRVWGGLGVNILSTPAGVIADKQAKKMKIGGELLIQVW
jgi:small subunit ribosomal protein S8